MARPATASSVAILARSGGKPGLLKVSSLHRSTQRPKSAGNQDAREERPDRRRLADQAKGQCRVIFLTFLVRLKEPPRASERPLYSPVALSWEGPEYWTKSILPALVFG